MSTGRENAKWGHRPAGVVGENQERPDIDARRVGNEVGIQLDDLVRATRVAEKVSGDRSQVLARANAMDRAIEMESIVDIGPSASTRRAHGVGKRAGVVRRGIVLGVSRTRLAHSWGRRGFFRGRADRGGFDDPGGIERLGQRDADRRADDQRFGFGELVAIRLPERL